jgi:hypothetical protein
MCREEDLYVVKIIVEADSGQVSVNNWPPDLWKKFVINRLCNVKQLATKFPNIQQRKYSVIFVIYYYFNCVIPSIHGAGKWLQDLWPNATLFLYIFDVLHLHFLTNTISISVVDPELVGSWTFVPVSGFGIFFPDPNLTPEIRNLLFDLKLQKFPNFNF